MDDFGTDSKKRILSALASSSRLTQNDIIEITGLSERTVKSAVRMLVSQKEIIERQNFRDMRRKNYTIREAAL